MKIPILPFIFSSSIFHRKICEKEVGGFNGYRVVREDYESKLFFKDSLCIYRAYCKNKSMGYVRGFPIYANNKSMFYIRKIKTEKTNNNLILNVKYFEQVVAKDIFDRGYDCVVSFMSPRLSKTLGKRIGYKKKKFTGLEGLIGVIASKIGIGNHVIKEFKNS